ncbi:MAG: hypothetical protein DHS20C17_17760 [Cyclobacteriaceae bacterium]|nr:MAG: hypothetical protein DHS20C17_17760 [Cyclobacteriaceae bacterium]
MLGYYQLYDGAYTFIEYNLLLNLGWKAGFSPEQYINQLMEQNPFIVGFGLLGMVWSITKTFSSESFKRGDYILIINLIGLLVGLFIIPVPWRQYYLIFLPLLGIFAASFLINTVNLLADTIKDLPSKTKALIGYVLLFLLISGLLTWFTIPDQQAISTSTILKKGLVMMAIVCGLIPLFFQKRDLAIIILIAAVHIPVVKKFINKYNINNQEQLANIHYVVENSPPDATFLDGWQGIGVFRPHAYFYWMLHEEIRGMLTEDQIQLLLTELRSGKIAPYFINLDEDLIDLSPELTEFVLKNYQEVGVAYLYKRNPDKLSNWPD